MRTLMLVIGGCVLTFLMVYGLYQLGKSNDSQPKDVSKKDDA